MTSRVVISARAWIGTPYLHQASVKGIGCDCLGLLRGLWREAFGHEPEQVPPYSADWSEPQRDEALLRAASRHLALKSLHDEAAGDVILFRMRAGSVAKHIGIAARVGPAPSFIHAYQGHCVTESALTLPWRQRIAARFAFPDNIPRSEGN
jgi:NlpC/P60 family putative phage cell wall peptidase